jgi:hypothetical protein
MYQRSNSPRSPAKTQKKFKASSANKMTFCEHLSKQPTLRMFLLFQITLHMVACARLLISTSVKAHARTQDNILE